MALSIVWTPRAQSHLYLLSEFLEKEFGTLVARNSIRAIHSKALALADFPELGLLQDAKKGIRCLIVSRHNSLLYVRKADRIVIFSMIDHRKLKGK